MESFSRGFENVIVAVSLNSILWIMCVLNSYLLTATRQLARSTTGTKSGYTADKYVLRAFIRYSL